MGACMMEDQTYPFDKEADDFDYLYPEDDI